MATIIRPTHAEVVAYQPLPRYTPAMILYVDTAISGQFLHRQGKTGPAIPDNVQPYLVRLAWMLEGGSEGQVVRQASHLLRLPEGVRMDQRAEATTGLFNQVLAERGMQPINVLKEFLEVLDEASRICAHNWQHHRHVLECSLRRINQAVPSWPPHSCVMTEATDLVKAPARQPSKNGWKWPSFDECWLHFYPDRKWQPTMNPVADGFSRVDVVRRLRHAVVQTQDA